MAWRLCAQASISVAMKIPSMGYGLHGHDITVTACACYRDKEGHVDLETLARTLEELLRPLDHRPLWEALGSEGTLEDLVEWVMKGLNGLMPICLVAAEARGRRVELQA